MGDEPIGRIGRTAGGFLIIGGEIFSYNTETFSIAVVLSRYDNRRYDMMAGDG